MPSLHRTIRFHSLRSIFKHKPAYFPHEMKPQPQPCQEKPLPSIPEKPLPPPPKELPSKDLELLQWRKEFQILIIKLYLEKPRLLSDLNKVAISAFGKKEWAAPFMGGRRNGIYTSEELFIHETLQNIGVVGEKRTEGNVNREVWPPPGVVWKGFRCDATLKR